jgi:hypothetical protein
MEEQELAVINIGDRHADPAETAIMRRYGDKSLLLIPLVHRGSTVGLLEVLDRLRERRFTRQELRLTRALAALAAVALQNAKVFGRLSRSNDDVQALQTALELVVDGLPAVAAASTTDAAVREAAALACRALPGISAVATCGAATARVSGVASGDARQDDAHVVTAEAATAGRGTLGIMVTLGYAAGDAHAALVRLIAMCAAQAIDRLP